jgi:predicted enzyme related to lactoylglutathione lyase/quinol monooxygenase YgiN
VTTSPTAPVHLIARWTLLKGREQEGIAALKRLAAEVLANEPDTLVYSFHTPRTSDPALPSLPAASPQEVVFYEAYRNRAAFEAHVKGPLFTKFLQQHGDLFLSPTDVLPGTDGSAAPRNPFVVLQFLELQDGFTRQSERVDGVALYQIEPGRLQGRWTASVPGYHGRTGIELAERPGSPPGGPAGQYHVRIWAPGDSISKPPIFEGTLNVTALPGGTDPALESYQLQWTSPQSPQAYTGLGLRPKGSNQLSVSYWNTVPPGAGQVISPAAPRPSEKAHRHPSVMFEILAQDQGPLLDFYRALFGWEYQFGAGNFAYVKFPFQPQPLMGGIGQGDPSVQGFEPGRNFYLLVDNLQATLDKAHALGGSTYVEPTIVDGYHCAMMRDPEGNIVGLIEPFTPDTGP